ncbi:MAG TPA: N-acetylmuramic acid 6-phosphate etherase [Mycobacteriales bacterium]|jgi:N-acetylmuramic acid 6-phosphate etherase|nr:N-acetylmuramic acid 6-phosphate etherase [Mycobacteriales bacterium]
MTTSVHVDSPTEGRNPATGDIDRLPTADVVRLILAEDATVPAAVAGALPELAQAVDLLVAVLRGGGRVHLAGAGTSGRLAALDADEIIPTYGLEPGRWTAHVAAYDGVVDGEDDTVAGAEIGALAGPGDVLVGVTASGRTPFAIAALRRARERGARTVLLSGNPSAAAGSEVDVHVAIRTGPEAVTGSTRLKAGTAQKLALNALSTATMVRCGRTWSNLMVGAVATNSKLRGRIAAALVAATGEDADVCAEAVEKADGDGRVALLTLLSGVSIPVARSVLAGTGGHLREALDLVATRDPAPNG